MKKEKIIDLKPKSITPEELKEVQDVVSGLNKAQMEIGNLETKKHMMLHNVVSMQDELQKVQLKLEEVYGKVNINIQDGTIEDIQDEQTDKKD
tara:strand:+ start:1014 stop:1292 length:279 start_codon:yes stop_codon:yes gene_type:complete